MGALYPIIMLTLVNRRNILYLHEQSSIWANESEDGKLITARVQPSFVNCVRDGQLPGCRYQFDDPNAQCTQGREGINLVDQFAEN